ncbi:hypothetical protein C8R42DRAFT_658765 [Lentinula raphanica]|nr:hypothetical protein C8R42DRAFT_658765 [Lentinula raphanica]
MQNISGNDLSLRHLPDLSNSSFSFEIPPDSNNDFLLDNDDDFFGAASNSFATPAPGSRTTQQSLTITRPTPKAVVHGNDDTQHSLSPPKKKKKAILSDSSHLNSVQAPHSSIEDSNKTRTKLAVPQKLQTDGPIRDEVMSTPQRMQRLRDEIKDLAASKNSLAPPISSVLIHKHNKGTLDPKAVNGGEMPSMPSTTAPSSLSLKVNRNVKDQIYSAEREDNDASDTSSTSGGLSEKLVKYAQNLVGSNKLSNPAGKDDSIPSVLTGSSSSQVQPSDCLGPAISQPSEFDTNMPLTLSQLSPSKTKVVETYSDLYPRVRIDVPPSPMRQSHKRRGSPVPNDHPAKRDKSADEGSSSTVSSGRHFIFKKRTPPSSNSSSASGKIRSKHPLQSSKTARNALAASKSSLRSLGPSSTERSKHSGLSAGSLASSSGSSKSTVNQSEHSTQVSKSQPTRPVGFSFGSDMRIEARKNTRSSAQDHEEEPRKKRRLHTAYTVPDFQASHSAQDALLTSLKGQIKPVVPLPVEMHTDARARERSKFDEQVREKELQASRALEEKKRQQAEEEEREIKEQRKKTIPKAHAVPDWYKDAPRRKESRPKSRSEGAS